LTNTPDYFNERVQLQDSDEYHNDAAVNSLNPTLNGGPITLPCNRVYKMGASAHCVVYCGRAPYADRTQPSGGIWSASMHISGECLQCHQCWLPRGWHHQHRQQIQ